MASRSKIVFVTGIDSKYFSVKFFPAKNIQVYTVFLIKVGLLFGGKTLLFCCK